MLRVVVLVVTLCVCACVPAAGARLVEPAASLDQELLPVVEDRALARHDLRPGFEGPPGPRQHGVHGLVAAQRAALGVEHLARREEQLGALAAVGEQQRPRVAGEGVHLDDVRERDEGHGAREAAGTRQGPVEGREQRAEHERLLDVLDGAALAHFLAHLGGAEGGHHHGRQRGRHGARLHEQLEARHAGHADVREQRRGRRLLDAGEGGLGLGEALELDSRPARLQETQRRPHQVGLVVHDHDAVRHLASSLEKRDNRNVVSPGREVAWSIAPLRRASAWATGRPSPRRSFFVV